MPIARIPKPRKGRMVSNALRALDEAEKTLSTNAIDNTNCSNILRTVPPSQPHSTKYEDFIALESADNVINTKSECDIAAVGEGTDLNTDASTVEHTHAYSYGDWWEKVYDDHYHAFYYRNSTTGETSWYAPSDFGNVVSAADGAGNGDVALCKQHHRRQSQTQDKVVCVPRAGDHSYIKRLSEAQVSITEFVLF
jgi:hypothetical protein